MPVGSSERRPEGIGPSEEAVLEGTGGLLLQ